MKWWKILLTKWRNRKRLKRSSGEVQPLSPPPPPPPSTGTGRVLPARPDNQTLGEKHNNPLNVKAFKNGRPSPNYWLGQKGVDSKGHAIFPSVPYGTRAAIITLRTYFTRHKLRTIHEILSRWAPVTDTIGSRPGAPPNDPSAYAKFVAAQMGVGVHNELPLFTATGKIRAGETLFALISAMAKYENHRGYILKKQDFEAATQLL